MLFNNIRKKSSRILQIGLLLGALLPLRNAEARQDRITAVNYLSNIGAPMGMYHREESEEGLDSFDREYAKSTAPSPNGYRPKAVTLIEGKELNYDYRPTDSITSFNVKLIGIPEDGNDITEENKLTVSVSDTTSFPGFDPRRHYTAEYLVYPEYTQSGEEFRERRNLRDFITPGSTFYDWDGPSVNIPASHTNEQGDVQFGEFNFECGWNQLVSTKEGNGTASFEGSEILDYGTNRTVTLNAEPGHYINHYILDRSGNERQRIVTTNNVGNASTNVSLENLVGSNSLHVVYSPSLTSAGTPHFWYLQRGVTNDFETVDTSPGTGDLTGREKYIMNVDSLEDDSDYFRNISLSSSNGIPRITIPHSKTNRNYIIEGTGSLFPSNWQYKTNSLGNNGTLELDMTEDKDGTWFYRGKVGLEEE